MADYRPPGVYITAQESPSLTVPGAGIAKMGIVGKVLSAYQGDMVAKEFLYFDDVVAEYGNIDANGLNEIVIGAYWAFKGGAPSVICSPYPSSGTRSDIDNAIARLEAEDVKLVVVIDDSASLWAGSLASLKSHCANMETAGKERIGIMGAQSALSVSAIASSATSTNSKRIAIVAPGSFYWTPPVTGASQLQVNSGFIACYLAGLICGREAQLPVTRQFIPYVEGLGNNYTVTEMNTLATAGVTVIEKYYNSYRVRHGITTKQSPTYYNEISVVRAEDRMVEILRLSFDALVPMPQNESTLPSVANYCKVILESLKKEGLIFDYQNIQAKQDQTEPRQVDITFEYKPAFPLNWIDIKFTIYV